MLKHHRKPCAQTLKFICVGHMHAVAVMPHPDQLVIQAHGAVVGSFQKVDTTQEGALARSAGADQADHIAGLGIERNALEHFVVAIAFMQVFNGQFVHVQTS
ncbi:hypothetical protein D9M71_578030 [compost metagenome]